MSLKDYQMVTKLGAGSFGVVYRVKLKKNGQLYVIKEIELSRLDARLKKWSMNEAKLMKEINSPYIVKYFNSFVQTSKLYIVMEHCSKGDLCKYIKSQMGKPIKEQTIWKFTIQIMIGLHNLHSKKILHRDIKTLNIFLDDEYNVRIGDLGTAKTLSTDFTHTIVGTPYYLSPEICEEKPYNEKTDIWAFGCLVYELCTGKHPFEAQNQAALALKIVMGKFQDIPSFYSKDLRWLIQSCLSVDYKRRPSINYLIERPFVIENAKKLNLTLNPGTNQKTQANIEVDKKEAEKKDPNILQIQSLVNNVNKKVDEAVKKVLPPQKPPVPQQNKLNIVKPQGKVSQQKRYSNKEFDNIKKAHDSSLQKRKQIDQKRGHLPIKPQQKPPVKNQNSQSSHQNKSKEKVKMQNLPPARVLINEKNAPIVAKIGSNEGNKNQKVQLKKELQKPKIPSQTQIVLAQKRTSTSNHDFMQKIEQKRAFNLQDENNIKKEETFVLKNLDCLDISKKSKNDGDLGNAKKTAFVNANIQKEVDDDDLMAQFGITPEKKEVLNDFSLMKTKSINWDLEVSKNSSVTPDQQQNSLGHTNKTKTKIQELPTIKTAFQSEQISVIEENNQYDGLIPLEENKDENFVQEDEDNKPYKSDDEDDNEKYEKSQQKSNQNNRCNEEEFQDEQDSRYLIQNIEAQFAEQGREALDKQIELYSKRLLENQKRLIHLENLRNHTEKEYFSHLSKETYQKLKQQINSENDKEVDKLMKELTKGKDMLVMKFLKIMGFEIEIERCQDNVKQCKTKISELKMRLEKGEFI